MSEEAAARPTAEVLTRAEVERYGRHLVMPEVGSVGQERLKAASALIVGAGGLGSPAALYLAAAGVGRLGLVDFDSVEATNLQRQILFGSPDVDRRKVEVARERLATINPHVEVEAIDARLDRSNALDLVGDYGVVIDGSDNFPTRYLVNDACVLVGRPNVFGSVLRFEGQVSVFGMADGPCYRCLFPEPPRPGVVPSCAEAGVLGVLPGIIGSLQALEAIKLLLGFGDPLVGRFLVFDGAALRFREIALHKSPNCPVCSTEPSQTGLVEYEDACPEPVSTTDTAVPFDIAPAELRRWLDEERDFHLVDVRTHREIRIASLDGATVIPLSELPGGLDELDRETTIVVYCHHGPRSRHAVAFLRHRGFARARNLAGGIDAWSREIDSSIPIY